MTYQKKRADYAQIYGADMRTVSRWRAANAPLDDEPAMRAWIEAHRGRRGVGKRSTRGRLGTAPEASVEVDPVTLEESGLGLAAAINRFREAERVASAAWASNPTSKNAEAWILIADQLRKIEKDNPEITKANDNSVDREEVNAVWSAALSVISEAIDAVPARMSLALEGLEALAIETKLKEEMRRLKGLLAEAPI